MNQQLDFLRAEKRVIEFHLELIKGQQSAYDRKQKAIEADRNELDKLTEKKFKRLQEIAEEMDKIQFDTTGE